MKSLKKISVAVMLLGLMFILMIGLGTTASAETYGLMEYEISDGEVTITGCDESISGALNIPSAIDGYPVVAIGGFAFSQCKNITDITIPDSVTRIGHFAFRGTEYYNNPSNWTDDVLYIGKYLIEAKWNVENCYIKDGTSTIADEAFSDSYSLKNVYITSSVKNIGEFAFSNCDSIVSMTIPNSVAHIGVGVLQCCESLISVTIGNGITHISDYAFYDCKSLTSVTIGDGVTNIGYCAFDSCRSLTSVTIPDSVTHIETSAFAYCESLTSVTIPDSV